MAAPAVTDSSFYRISATLFGVGFKLLYDWRLHYRAPLPEGSFLVAANHVSFLDPPLLGAALYHTHGRPISYLARKTLFDHPISARLFPMVNAYPVDQERADAAGLKKAISLLRGGHTMTIFPEGSRSFDGHFQPVSGGVGLLMAKARVPVLPARIFGGFEVWPRTQKLPKLFKPIDIIFGEPMDLSDFLKENPKAYEAAAQKVMNAIGALQPLPHERRELGPEVA